MSLKGADLAGLDIRFKKPPQRILVTGVGLHTKHTRSTINTGINTIVTPLSHHLPLQASLAAFRPFESMKASHCISTKALWE